MRGARDGAGGRRPVQHRANCPAGIHNNLIAKIIQCSSTKIPAWQLPPSHSLGELRKNKAFVDSHSELRTAPSSLALLWGSSIINYITIGQFCCTATPRLGGRILASCKCICKVCMSLRLSTVSVSSEPDSSGYDPTPKLLFRSVVMTIIWKHVFMLLICITSENSSYKRFAPEHYTSYKLTTIIIFDGVLIIKFKWRTYFCF